MTEREPEATIPSLPDVILYSKPGCGLCDEARLVLEQLLAQRAAEGRPVPPFLERDITADPEWERAFFLTIPVIELGNQRLELVTSLARIRRLLDDVLDGVTAGA